MTPFRAFVGVVVAMVAAVVIGGMWLAGSPGTVRSQNFDTQRVNDLQQISSAIDSYFDATGGLPASLAELQTGGKVPYYVSSTADPETKRPYDYRTTGATTYQLCAAFSLPTQKDDPSRTAPMAAPAPYGVKPTDWTHPAGDHCYDLDASAHVPPQICGLTNPCAAGQTCAALPGRRGTVCVPQGKECLAAGCADQCVMSETYPVTITCGSAAHPAPPTSAAPPTTCKLMQEKKTGQVKCVACTDHACTGPSAGWQTYEPQPGHIGIPYACSLENGSCVLAQ